MNANIQTYHKNLTARDRKICVLLKKEIEAELTKAESKVWHGHPVWFLDGNPIVGYSRSKDGVCLLFWSGRSFKEKGLQPEGGFKAAEVRYKGVQAVNVKDLCRWLKKQKPSNGTTRTS